MEHEHSPTVFSLSATRASTSFHREWAYVDSWLSTHLPEQPLHFERNTDTLKAFLALAVYQESTLEQRRIVSRARNETLYESASVPHNPRDSEGRSFYELRENLLALIESDLSREGRTALVALASIAMHTNILVPDLDDLGHRIIQIQKDLCETEQMVANAKVLDTRIRSEISEMVQANCVLQDDAHALPIAQAIPLKENVDNSAAIFEGLQRDREDNMVPLGSAALTIDHLMREEQIYLSILEEKQEYEKQLKVFQGLPTDPGKARMELENLRQQLQGITLRRDAVFEGLVERESPAKKR